MFALVRRPYGLVRHLGILHPVNGYWTRAVSILAQLRADVGGERHRLIHQSRRIRAWQSRPGIWPAVAGAAQGDRAARRPGRLPVQPDNGNICRILPEPLQSCRCIPLSGGDRRTCSRHVRARIRRCRTGTRAERRPNRNAGWIPDRPSRRDHIAGCSLTSPCRLSVPFLH